MVMRWFGGTSNFILVVLAVCVVAACVAPSALAQGAAEATQQDKPRTMWDSIKAGGLIGFLIILMSFVSLTLIILFAMEFRRDKLVPPELLGQIESLLDDEEYEEAMTLCEAQPAFLTNVVAAALPKVSLGFDEVQKAAESAANYEATKLHIKLGFLSLIGATAPMMGLFGTVTGMIKAFNVLASSRGQASAADLADSISMALVTTAEGLTVAIPTTVAFVILRSKVIATVEEVQAITGELMERFRVGA